MKGSKIIIIAVLLFACIAIYEGIYKPNQLKHGILLNAKATKWVSGAYIGVNLEYEFYYNGERKVGENAFNTFRGNMNFIDKYFPVMYDPKYGSSDLLVQPSNFKRYNIPFPDSLNWVLEYLK